MANCNLAFNTAEKYLEVPILLDAEDVAEARVDEQSITTYLSYYKPLPKPEEKKEVESPKEEPKKEEDPVEQPPKVEEPKKEEPKSDEELNRVKNEVRNKSN